MEDMQPGDAREHNFAAFAVYFARNRVADAVRNTGGAGHAREFFAGVPRSWEHTSPAPACGGAALLLGRLRSGGRGRDHLVVFLLLVLLFVRFLRVALALPEVGVVLGEQLLQDLLLIGAER